MCGPQFECNDAAASRPKIELLLRAESVQGEVGVIHLESAAHETPQQLVEDLARSYQRRAGSDYVRIVDA